MLNHVVAGGAQEENPHGITSFYCYWGDRHHWLKVRLSDVMPNADRR
jgi:hypothetical protein